MKLHIWIAMARGLDKVDEQSDLHSFEMGMLYIEHKRFCAKKKHFFKTSTCALWKMKALPCVGTELSVPSSSVIVSSSR